MKILTAATTLLLLRHSTGQSCPSELSQSLTISETLTLFYDVVEDTVLCARMESQTEGWLGFGISPSGSMIPAESVIGLPDESTVLKYDLTSKDDSGVVAMSDDKQTLADAAIVQENGMTILSFTKILNEDQFPLVIGDNSCIFAQAGSNTLGYHGGDRGGFTLNLVSSSDSDATTPATSAADVIVSTTSASDATAPATSAADVIVSTTSASDEMNTPAPTIAANPYGTTPASAETMAPSTTESAMKEDPSGASKSIAGNILSVACIVVASAWF